eukprot:362646-Prorocentrum_minimum.AAC.3
MNVSPSVNAVEVAVAVGPLKRAAVDKGRPQREQRHAAAEALQLDAEVNVLAAAAAGEPVIETEFVVRICVAMQNEVRRDTPLEAAVSFPRRTVLDLLPHVEEAVRVKHI